MRALSGLFGAFLLATPVSADPPRVVTDIAPVHALAAQVMDGIGVPEMIVRPGASPHGYALRPSEAAALQDADIVLWVGPALTPWLSDTLDTLADDARHVTLLHVPGIRVYPPRTGARFEAHKHDHGHEHEHEHEDEHEHAEHDEHTDTDGHDEAHDHAEMVDPHAWLDPENGKLWLDAIAEALTEADPENAALYRTNARAGQDRIDAVATQIAAMLAPHSDAQFIVFHDAYQAFEERFGLSAAGAISLGDASQPSAARIQEIRATVKELEVTCVFSEPQFDTRTVATVLEGTRAETAVLDPVGSALTPGPSLYPALLRALGQSIADCL